jgi:hypothetical protein
MTEFRDFEHFGPPGGQRFIYDALLVRPRSFANPIVILLSAPDG